MRFPIPFSSYGSTRKNEDFQQRINVYDHSDGGVRQMPGAQSPLLSGVSVGIGATGKTYSTTESADTVDSCYGNAGAKMYVLDSNSGGTGTVYQYSLSTAYDPSTATYDSKSLNVGTDVKAIAIKDDDGSILYALDSPNVVEFDLSTAWDVSTGTSGDSFSVATQLSGTRASSIAFGQAYGVMYVGGDFNDPTIYQYSLTSGALNTAAYASKSFDVSGILSSGILSLDVRTSGGSMLVAGYRSTTKYLVVLQFGTAFDAATLSFNHMNDGTSVIPSTMVSAKWRATTGTQILIAAADTVYRYSTSDAYRVDVSGLPRAAIEYNGALYLICGNTLYSVSGAAAVVVGLVLDCVGLAVGNDDLVIVGPTKRYTYDGSTLLEITDADLGASTSAAFLDGRFYYQQTAGQFAAGGLNTPESVASQDYATAEHLADDIVRMFNQNDYLYPFGSKSIEVWYGSGSGRPPVDQQDIIERGLIAREGINSIDNVMYFLDHERRPNRMSGLSYESIYTPALGEVFDGYATVSDCRVSCFTIENETFALFSFPTEDEAWFYHELSGKWSKWSGDTPYYIIGIGGTLLVVYASNSIVVVNELNTSDYTTESASVSAVAGTVTHTTTNLTRTIDTVKITSDLFGESGRKLSMPAFEITVDSSAAASLTVSISRDGTAFAGSRTIAIPAGVSLLKETQWGVFREGIMRLSTDSDARVDILNPYADLVALNV